MGNFNRKNALSQTEGRAPSMFLRVGLDTQSVSCDREQRRIRVLPLQSIYAVSQKHRRLAFPGGPELRVLERWHQLSRDERGPCKRGHVRAIECRHPYYFRM